MQPVAQAWGRFREAEPSEGVGGAAPGPRVFVPETFEQRREVVRRADRAEGHRRRPPDGPVGVVEVRESDRSGLGDAHLPERMDRADADPVRGMLGPFDERGGGRRVADPAEGHEDRRLLPGLGAREQVQEERHALAVPVATGHDRRRHANPPRGVLERPADGREVVRVRRPTDPEHGLATDPIDRVVYHGGEGFERLVGRDPAEREGDRLAHGSGGVRGPSSKEGDRTGVPEGGQRDRGLGSDADLGVVERSLHRGPALRSADRSEGLDRGRPDPGVRVVHGRRERGACSRVPQDPERHRGGLADPRHGVAERDEERSEVP